MYEIHGVGVDLGGRPILRNVDLALAPGRLVAIVGPNGAGKSTLLRTIAGERRPSTGTVRLHGRDVAALSPAELAGWRAVLAQSIALAVPFEVGDVVRLGIARAVRAADIPALVRRALAAVELPGTESRPITHLSGGEQQRVHVARVLVQLWSQAADGLSRYLLLDEPTSHLDLRFQLLVLRLARAHADAGGGVLAILHDINLAVAFADEIGVMQGGALIAYGEPREVLTTRILSATYGIDFEFVDHHDRQLIFPELKSSPLGRP